MGDYFHIFQGKCCDVGQVRYIEIKNVPIPSSSHSHMLNIDTLTHVSGNALKSTFYIPILASFCDVLAPWWWLGPRITDWIWYSVLHETWKWRFLLICMYLKRLLKEFYSPVQKQFGKTKCLTVCYLLLLPTCIHRWYYEEGGHVWDHMT